MSPEIIIPTLSVCILSVALIMRNVKDAKFYKKINSRNVKLGSDCNNVLIVNRDQSKNLIVEWEGGLKVLEPNCGFDTSKK